MAQQTRTLEETWAECQTPFKRVLSDLLVGLDRKKYMDLYTYVSLSTSIYVLLYDRDCCYLLYDDCLLMAINTGLYLNMCAHLMLRLKSYTTVLLPSSALELLSW